MNWFRDQQRNRSNNGRRSNNIEQVERKLSEGEDLEYCMLSRKGMNPRKIKVNQDRYVGIEGVLEKEDSYLFGVFDGHGAEGELVAQFIADQLPERILKDFNAKEDGFISAFEATNEALKDEASINSLMSGTTAVCVLLDERFIYSAFCGDSRAVLTSKVSHGETVMYESMELSTDHKPELPEESARILSKKGRIESCRGYMGEPIGPKRVWLANRNLPGLAMSRSFGDLLASSVGVIATPEISIRERRPEDHHIIIASDGVWEFISSEEASEMVAESKSPEEACELLMKESVRRWQQEDEVIDDITVTVIFL